MVFLISVTLFVYVIFQDGTDIYWARSRVLEYLSRIQSRLPEGVQENSDLTQQVLLGISIRPGRQERQKLINRHSLFQDFKLRYLLNAIPGVAEVVGIGGFKTIPGHSQSNRSTSPRHFDGVSCSKRLENQIKKQVSTHGTEWCRIYDSRKGYIRVYLILKRLVLTDTTGTPF